jgi:hypothetical protein
MKCIEESKIYWYNTRAGRTIVRPQVGDKITFNDVVGIKPIKKTRTRKQRRAHLQPRPSSKVRTYNIKSGPISNVLVKKNRDPFKGYDTTGTYWIKSN